MSQFAIYKALDIFADIFQRIQPHPMSWSKKQQTFVQIKDHKKLSNWYFAMGILVFSICCCVYICLKELFLKQTTIPYWLSGVYFAAAIFGTLLFAFNFIAWIYSSEIVSSWNDYKNLGDRIKSGWHIYCILNFFIKISKLLYDAF